MNRKPNQDLRLLACFSTTLLIGLFSCKGFIANEVKFTISDQSNGFIDSIQIHIPSAQAVAKGLKPQASATAVLQYDPSAVPNVDGSFVYSLYFEDGFSRKGSFGYYTNGWVDYFDTYELIINKDSTISGRGIK